MTALGMKRGAASVLAAILSGMVMAAPVDAAVIASHDYNLFSHPDGNQAPPIYACALMGSSAFSPVAAGHPMCGPLPLPM
ncbi:hypothetical protein [Iodidimonas nitroreducens]|nr:hypothetical protein [Iodidimonas nitroreducens]